MAPLSRLILCVFILRINGSVFGCFANLPLSEARRQISVTSLNDKIYFAGGRLTVTNHIFSNLVEVLDTRTNTWCSFNITIPRGQMTSVAVDPYVLFIGGQTFSSSAQIADIWNTQTETLQTIDIPDSLLGTSQVVGRSVFLHSSRQTLYALNVDTLEWTHYGTYSIRSMITNGTHLFALMDEPANLIQVFDPISTLSRWTKLMTVTTGANRLLFGSANNMLYAVGSRLTYYIHLTNLTVGLYAYPTLEASTNVIYLVDDDIYMVYQDTLVIHNPLQQRSSQYIFDRLFVGGFATFHNGTLYVPEGFQGEGVRTLNVKSIFHPLPNVDRTTAPIMFERGVMFWEQRQESRIYTYNVEATEFMFHEHPAFVSGLSAFNRRLLIGDKLIFRSGTQDASVQHLFIYNFDDGAMNVVNTPDGFAFGTATSLGEIGAFLTGGLKIFLYNTTSNTFSWRQFPIRPNNLFATRDMLVLDINRKLVFWSPYTDEMDDTSLESHLAQPVTLDTMIITMIFLPNWWTPETTVAVVYDVVTGETQRKNSKIFPVYRMFSRVVNQYVVFVGETLDRTGLRVEIFDSIARRWIEFDLPSARPANRLLDFTNIGDVMFFGVGLFIDIYDLSTNKLSVFPFQVPQLQTLNSIGSKLIVASSSSRGTVAEYVLLIYEYSNRRYFTTSFYSTTSASSVLTWKNSILLLFHQHLKMEIPAVFDAFDDTQLFIGQSTNFSVRASGQGLRYAWTQDNRRLSERLETLQLSNVTLSSEGTYKLTIVDNCDRPMEHSAQLLVHHKPYFSALLEDSIALCHEEIYMSVEARGKDVEYRWSVNDELQSNGSGLTLTREKLLCNSSSNVCVTAHNPSGEVTSCARVRLAELDALITGPFPAVQPSQWHAEQVVELQVNILDEDCQQHDWLKDGVLLASFTSASSKCRVELDTAMAYSQFVVAMQCGKNITSRPFIFGEISALPIWGLVLILLGITAAVAVFITVLVLYRKRLIQSRHIEVELTTLLSKAKTESLKKDAMPIINATTWEWVPTDDFSFRSIGNLPLTVNSTELCYAEKGAPLDVDMYYNRVIKFENKSKEVKGLQQKLLSGVTVDIYAPKSPKYQIIIEPASFVLESNEAKEITISLKMRMTTKCKLTLVLVLEQYKIYSAIEFKVASNMSTWIDLEEIQKSGEFLGGGGFGAVTRGVYRGQDVAVKKLINQYLTDDMKIEFEREVTLMRSLRHPNIVQFIGASNVKESLAIVIEFAPLGSLAGVMEKQQLSLSFKVMCLLEIAKALQFLHSNGIIHRDIKPQNILMFSLEPKAQVHVKLTDFGTARFISDDPTTITKNVGTIAFMSPEALGRNPRIDKSADVYSFGILVWSVIFEQTPFKEFKWDSDIESHVKSGKRLNLEQRDYGNEKVIKLIEDCWHQDPTSRPEMNTVVQRLAALL